LHGNDGIYFFLVHLNTSITNDETESFSRSYAKDTLCRVELPSKSLQAVEGFFQIRDKLVMHSGVDHHIVHVGFNVPMEVVGKT